MNKSTKIQSGINTQSSPVTSEISSNSRTGKRTQWPPPLRQTFQQKSREISPPRTSSGRNSVVVTVTKKQNLDETTSSMNTETSKDQVKSRTGKGPLSVAGSSSSSSPNEHTSQNNTSSPDESSSNSAGDDSYSNNNASPYAAFGDSSSSTSSSTNSSSKQRLNHRMSPRHRAGSNHYHHHRQGRLGSFLPMSISNPPLPCSSHDSRDSVQYSERASSQTPSNGDGSNFSIQSLLSNGGSSDSQTSKSDTESPEREKPSAANTRKKQHYMHIDDYSISYILNSDSGSGGSSSGSNSPSEDQTSTRPSHSTHHASNTYHRPMKVRSIKLSVPPRMVVDKKALETLQHRLHFKNRHGRWTTEELALAKFIVKSYYSGLLPLNGEESLRGLLQEKLRCPKNRITKKMGRIKISVGHTKNSHQPPKQASEEEIEQTLNHIDKLQLEFEQGLIRKYCSAKSGRNPSNADDEEDECDDGSED